MPGVRIEDCGEKLGLNGVDNGRIWFDQVRVPREALLNRYADVSPEGEYSSPIENVNARFFTMLGTLVQGRVSRRRRRDQRGEVGAHDRRALRATAAGSSGRRAATRRRSCSTTGCTSAG